MHVIACVGSHVHKRSEGKSLVLCTTQLSVFSSSAVRKILPATGRLRVGVVQKSKKLCEHMYTYIFHLSKTNTLSSRNSIIKTLSTDFVEKLIF